MIRHIVLWKLKAQDRQGKVDATAAIAGALEPLVGVVPGLQSLKISPNTAFPESNWDVALVADFPAVAELVAYQEHPDHVAATATVREHTAERAAVDFEV